MATHHGKKYVAAKQQVAGTARSMGVKVEA